MCVLEVQGIVDYTHLAERFICHSIDGIVSLYVCF